MDENNKVEYKMYPNENNALTKEAAKDVRRVVAQIEKEVNEILEEDYEQEQSKTR